MSVRPERFGALLYHFGTRRLSFLKSPALLTVVRELGDAPSAREACRRAGVTEAELPAYATALQTLASSQMIRPREDHDAGWRHCRWSSSSSTAWTRRSA